MAKIIDIEGIGPVNAEKLKKAGIASVDKLLKDGATKKGRTAIAEKTGISEKMVLEWVNSADLYRIKGIGSEYSQLLETAGVDTVVELATRKAENLFKKLAEVNAEKNLVRKLPALSMVEKWIAEAKKLPRVIEH